MTDMDPVTSCPALLALRERLREFAAARDWDQFHTPRNLAMALAVEAAELLEPFQWLTDEQSRNLAVDQRAAVQEEMADVLLYLVRLADRLDVDLIGAAYAKLAQNALKYPAERVRGSARKYTHWGDGRRDEGRDGARDGAK
jgi:dCTP diphosphatase